MYLLNQTYKEMGKRDVELISSISKIQYNPILDISYVKEENLTVPKLMFKLDKEGKLPAYGFENTSHFLDDLLNKSIEFINKLLEIAEKEHLIVKNVMSFKKINRRLNGLNNSIIPELQLEIRRIKDKLGEIDRENYIRLKKTKDLIIKKKGWNR